MVLNSRESNMAGMGVLFVLIFCCAFVLANTSHVLKNLDHEGLDNRMGDDTLPPTVQSQMLGKLKKETRYDPDTDIEYHLFTRSNPTVSQPLLTENADLLVNSNFDPRKRIVVLIHGGNGSATDAFNSVMVPAFLASDDVNVIVVDWNQGSVLGNEVIIASAKSMARFINWLKFLTGAPAESFHVVGFSLGVPCSGAVSKSVEGGIGYITALDGAPWEEPWKEQGFHRDDALYTEAIFTNSGRFDIEAHVNFYPNGGSGNMPGCGDNPGCNHFRAYFYMAEAIVSGGFIGIECATVEDAIAGTCDLPGRMEMGSRYPSYGAEGFYYLETNASPPFAQG